MTSELGLMSVLALVTMDYWPMRGLRKRDIKSDVIGKTYYQEYGREKTLHAILLEAGGLPRTISGMDS
jgi:hypothetical protein